MQIVLVGASHRTASVDLRERLAFTPEQTRHAAGELLAGRCVDEAVVLSTCNRCEIYAVSNQRAAAAVEGIEGYWADSREIHSAELAEPLYRLRNSGAVRHLFRVAAGLDSMLLGEAEILGQVRDAYSAALDHGSTGPVLNRLFQSALETGKRVRAETDLGSRPMSVAFAAVRLAEKIFGKLRGHTALILGAGSVGEQAVEHMHDRGIGRVLVANRTAERSDELVRRVGGETVEWEALDGALTLPDVVVASVAASEPLLTRERMEHAMHARANRPLFLIDLGVPRNVAAEAGTLYNVYLYDLNGLTEIVEQNRRAREHEIPRAEAIVAEHVARFEAWQASVLAARLIAELREKLEHERDAFLEEFLDTLPHLSVAERERVAHLTQKILAEVLAESPGRIPEHSELRRRLQKVAAVQELFALARER